jgi:hypothetical protein
LPMPLQPVATPSTKPETAKFFSILRFMSGPP